MSIHTANPVTLNTATALVGQAHLPGDKSISHRAILFTLLAQGKYVLKNTLLCEDTKKSLEIVQQLGVRVAHNNQNLTEHQMILIGPKELSAPHKPLDCGRSGTTMRLLMGILAKQDFDSILTGDPQLLKRPMQRIIEPLTHLGAKIETCYDADHHIKHYFIKAKKNYLSSFNLAPKIASAQLKSALLLAGLSTSGNSQLKEKHQTRDHTERLLIAMGTKISMAANKSINLHATPQYDLSGYSLEIPSDPSSAAFIATAVALIPGSKVILKNISVNPTRTTFFRFLQEIGVHIAFSKKKRGIESSYDISITGDGTLSSFDLNESMLPLLIDELPLIALIGSQCEGESTVKGASELKVKESDRLGETSRILQTFAANIKVADDGWLIKGKTDLKGCEVDASDDHRLIMMASIAALISNGQTTILDTNAVKDSFPSFYTCLQALGAQIHLKEELEISW